MAFKKGNIPWNKNPTEEIRKKIIACQPDRFGKNNPMYGKPSWNRGKHGIFSEEEKQRRRERHSGKISPVWKGDAVKYKPLHAWLRRHKPKVECCEWCGEKRKLYHLANVTGRYTRCFDDYQWFCVKCHHNYDLKVRNLKEMTDNIRCYLDTEKLPGEKQDVDI